MLKSKKKRVKAPKSNRAERDMLKYLLTDAAFCSTSPSSSSVCSAFGLVTVFALGNPSRKSLRDTLLPPAFKSPAWLQLKGRVAIAVETSLETMCSRLSGTLDEGE